MLTHALTKAAEIAAAAVAAAVVVPIVALAAAGTGVLVLAVVPVEAEIVVPHVAMVLRLAAKDPNSARKDLGEINGTIAIRGISASRASMDLMLEQSRMIQMRRSANADRTTGLICASRGQNVVMSLQNQVRDIANPMLPMRPSKKAWAKKYLDFLKNYLARS